jgi:hypothetical protein
MGLRQGDLAIFAVRDRPANGVRGIYQASTRRQRYPRRPAPHAGALSFTMQAKREKQHRAGATWTRAQCVGQYY